ncbi:MAG: hypothetical protein KatS3mg002_1105 [Candidatus Woesearchaeota archaeon]|nr:MAG: hypothetical protein KatS3mg002_1105 [Candidatus Woesearchaeota archaeon]
MRKVNNYKNVAVDITNSLIKLENGDKQVICNKIVYCDNFFKKGTGLILRTKKSIKNTAWIFTFNSPRRISLTMFFVFFQIDVLFLNSRKEIVEMTSLNPWSNYTSRKKANYAIELESGTIRNFDLRVGDKLFFIDI